MNHAKIVILDEVNVTVSGLRDHDLKQLKDKFAVYTKNYRHSPKFKLGVWDGKINFFKGNGKTYLKLLPEIINYLKSCNYDIDLVDNRSNFDLSVPRIDKNYLKDLGYDVVLGDHQVRGVNALTQESGGIFEGCTGCGKTIMCAVLGHLYERELGFKCIIIVPKSDLVEQTHKELTEFGLDVGMYSGASKNVNHQHIVSTWQSLQNNRGLIGQFQTVIVDECHGVRGDVLKEILNENGANCLVRIGVTGTIPEDDIDRMSIRITLGDVVEGVEAIELMRMGWLAQLNLYCYELTENVREDYHKYCEDYPEEASSLTYTEFKEKFKPDYQGEKKFIQKKPERLEFLAKLIRQGIKNSLILVPNIEFGKKIHKLVPNSIFLYGKDTAEIRQEIYRSFDDNDDIIVISTYSLASTGLNIRRIFNLYMIDAGKSYVEVIQSIGRGLRKAHDKDKINVYDIYSDLTFAKRHAAKRRKHYEKKTYPFKRSKVDYLSLVKGELA